MLEAEQSFVTDTTDITTLCEAMLKSVTAEILDKCEEDIINASKIAKQPVDFKWLQKPFPTLTYAEAIEILIRHTDSLKTPVQGELSKEHELFLVKELGGPVFIVDWPVALKPFYMRPRGGCDDANTVEAMDLLMPVVGELIGGSVRDDSYERLRRKVPDNMEWYLQLRRYGGIRTGGFGMGFERYLQVLLGVTNIKDVIPFPRWAHNCAM